MNQSIWIAGN